MFWLIQLGEAVIFKICIAGFWIICIFYEIGISLSFQFFRKQLMVSEIWVGVFKGQK